MDQELIARVTQALMSPPWAAAPDETDPRFRPVWRAVSIHLQAQIRAWIAADYLADVHRCAERLRTNSVIVYAAMRPYYPALEFVWDPSDPETIRRATSLILRSLVRILSGLHPRIQAAGMPELACRYRPQWAEDIRRDVAERPESLLKLIAAEGILIDTIITLGAGKGRMEVRNFAKLAGRSLVIGSKDSRWSIDQRPLYLRALEEAGRQLQRI